MLVNPSKLSAISSKIPKFLAFFFYPLFIHSLAHFGRMYQVNSCVCICNGLFHFPPTLFFPYAFSLGIHLVLCSPYSFALDETTNFGKLQWCVCSALIVVFLFNLSCACQILSCAHFILHIECIHSMLRATTLNIWKCICMRVLIKKKKLKTFTCNNVNN